MCKGGANVAARVINNLKAVLGVFLYAKGKRCAGQFLHVVGSLTVVDRVGPFAGSMPRGQNLTTKTRSSAGVTESWSVIGLM